MWNKYEWIVTVEYTKNEFFQSEVSDAICKKKHVPEYNLIKWVYTVLESHYKVFLDYNWISYKDV